MNNTNMVLFITVTTLLVTLMYYIISHRIKIRRLGQPSVTLPPSPPRLPIIGHLHLLTDMPHHSLTKLAQKYGPIVHLKLGQVPTIVISSAQLANEVLKVHDHVFCTRPQLIAAQYLSFGCSDVTFSPYGPYWRQARRICVAELLSPRRVDSFRLVRDEETTRVLHAVSTQFESEVDVSRLFFDLANNVLCRVAFGRSFMDTESTRSWMEVLAETQELFAGFCVGDFFPSWGWVNSASGFRRRLERNLEELRSVCEEIIEEHLKKKKNDKEDFVDVLLRVQKQEGLQVPITDDNVKALVLDMFVAGTDTTASALEFTMTELARSPTLMKKAQDEVRGLRPKGNKINEAHLPQLGLLKAIIKEALRLHPPVPLLVPRESMGPCMIDGYYIPPKTRVLVNAYAIGRDPGSWDNPLRFNPMRFLVEETHNGHDQVRAYYKDQDLRLLPFGGGRRGCPGFGFALATIELTLARMLYHFDWGLPNDVEAHQLDFTEIFGLDVRKKNPLILIPTLNKDHPL